jgi:CHAT domain-containing protein
VTRDAIEILPVTVVSRVLQLLRLLRFQLSKFRLGPDYAEQFSQPLLQATENHLESLYAELVAPLRPLLQGNHLVVVPHGPLHFLPFHALRQGDTYLCDSFSVSYAPSATMFALCQQRAAGKSPVSLVLGIPDERAPHILGEVQAVASLLPSPELFLGEQATSAVLRDKGPQCGLLHIATHGIYRQDNPLFSGIRLGDGYLSLYDLYQLRLAARLVTLSGCATGMNVVAAGDELIGLERGLFYAGATTLLLSLWDVHDRSAAELMRAFYEPYMRTKDPARALQAAMHQIRQQTTHPFFWAPFIVVGKVSDPTGSNQGLRP